MTSQFATIIILLQGCVDLLVLPIRQLTYAPGESTITWTQFQANSMDGNHFKDHHIRLQSWIQINAHVLFYFNRDTIRPPYTISNYHNIATECANLIVLPIREPTYAPGESTEHANNQTLIIMVTVA